MTGLKAPEIRCFKDDAVMYSVPGDPSRLRCSLCGLVADRVYYHAETIRDDFSDIFEGDGALYPNGHMAPLVRQDKRGGGGGRSRRCKKPVGVKPAPIWTLV